MPKVGTQNQDMAYNAGGGFIGPFYYVNPAFTDKEDFPNIYAIAYDPDYVTNHDVTWKVFKSIDGGNVWVEQDTANRPVLNAVTFNFGDGETPEAFAAVQDDTKIYLLLAEYDGSSAPANAYDLRLYEFDMSTNTWSSLITTMPAKVSRQNGAPDDHGKFAAGIRSNGDIVVAYQYRETPELDNWIRTWVQVWDGSAWLGSPVSVGDGDADETTATHDAHTCPDSIVIDAADRAYIAGTMESASGSAPYNEPWVWITVLSSGNVITDTQMFVTTAQDAGSGFPSGPGLVGTGAFSSDKNQVGFCSIHDLTSGPVYFGVKAIYATASDTPTWTVEELVSTSEMTASGNGLSVNQHPDGFYCNCGCFYDRDGALVCAWGATWSKFAHAKLQSDGTWTAPAYLNYIPTYAASQFPITYSLSFAVDPNGFPSVFGLFQDSTDEWLAFEQLQVPQDSTLAGASAPPPVGVSF